MKNTTHDLQPLRALLKRRGLSDGIQPKLDKQMRLLRHCLDVKHVKQAKKQVDALAKTLIEILSEVD